MVLMYDLTRHTCLISLNRIFYLPIIFILLFLKPQNTDLLSVPKEVNWLPPPIACPGTSLSPLAIPGASFQMFGSGSLSFSLSHSLSRCPLLPLRFATSFNLTVESTIIHEILSDRLVCSKLLKTKCQWPKCRWPDCLWPICLLQTNVSAVLWRKENRFGWAIQALHSYSRSVRRLKKDRFLPKCDKPWGRHTHISDVLWW